MDENAGVFKGNDPTVVHAAGGIAMDENAGVFKGVSTPIDPESGPGELPGGYAEPAGVSSSPTDAGSPGTIAYSGDVASSVAAGERPRVYVAGDFGFRQDGREFLARCVAALEGLGFAVLNPWTLTPPEEIQRVFQLPPGEEQEREREALASRIGERNRLAMEQADLGACRKKDGETGRTAKDGTEGWENGS